MAKGEQRSDREAKKPKKQKIKGDCRGAKPEGRRLAADLAASGWEGGASD